MSENVETMRQLFAAWDADDFEGFLAFFDEEFIDAPGHVVVRTVQGGRGSGGGVPVTGPVWFVCGLRGGRLVTWDIYATREQAVDAVGLRE